MSTLPEHMPERHSKQQRWTPGRLKQWAADIGPSTLCWVSERLEEKAHAEQAYRLCLGLLSLSREYPPSRSKPVASWPTGKVWCGSNSSSRC